VYNRVLRDCKSRELIPIDELLVDNSWHSRNNLKRRLFEEGHKERKCEKCGQDENWHGEHISMILDHINGVHNDDRLENLRILCPNCNAALPTHCGKNAKKKKENRYVNHCECGKEISLSSKQCVKCEKFTQRKVERPSFEQLIQEINELGYSATSRKYDVSDNAIRKWVKAYKTS